MTKAIKAIAVGIKPHFKIRVVIPGALLHLASWGEPEIRYSHGQIDDVFADWISDPEYGDTIGRINWHSVAAITWRWSQ